MSPDWWRCYSLLSPVSPRKWEFSTYHQETVFSIFQLLKQRSVLSGFNLPFGWRYFWALGYKYDNFLKQFSTWVALLRKIKIDGRGQLPSRRSILCVQEERPSPDKEMSWLDPRSCCPAFCWLHRTWSVDPERSRRFDPTPWRERHSVSQKELTAYPTPHSFVLFVFCIIMEHNNI